MQFCHAAGGNDDLHRVGFLQHQREASSSELLRVLILSQPHLPFIHKCAQSLFLTSHTPICSRRFLGKAPGRSVHKHIVTREWYNSSNSSLIYLYIFPSKADQRKLTTPRAKGVSGKNEKTTHYSYARQTTRKLTSKNLAFPQLACSQFTSAKISTLLNSLWVCVGMLSN